MTRLDPAEVAELRELEAKATPGPWHREMIELRPGTLTLGIGAPTRPVCIVHGIVESPVGRRDVDFMTSARNALPALLDAADAAEVLAHAVKGATAENEALRAENERLRGLLGECAAELESLRFDIELSEGLKLGGKPPIELEIRIAKELGK